MNFLQQSFALTDRGATVSASYICLYNLRHAQHAVQWCRGETSDEIPRLSYDGGAAVNSGFRIPAGSLLL